MKNNNIIVLLIISLLLNGLSSIEVIAVEIPPSMHVAYDEITAQRPAWGAEYSINDFDVDIWNEYNVLVLNLPGTFPSNLSNLKEPDGSSNDYNSSADEYRYIGKNPDGYLVNNPQYPEDHAGSAVINTYDWQINTDGKTKINQYILTMEDKEFYENEIFYFLESEYGPRFDENEDPSSWLANAIVIVPVSSTGKGVIKYMHKWDSNHDGVKENWYITVNLRSMNEVEEEHIEEEPTEDITNLPLAQLDSHAAAVIQADPRGNEVFDASVAVPTSDTLYIQVQAKAYLYELDYQHITGSKTYPVTVTRSYKLIKGVKNQLTGEVKEVSKTVSVSKTYQIVRPYNFYLVQRLGVFSLSQAVIENDALPNGMQTLSSSVNVPQVELNRDDNLVNHMTDPVSGPVALTLPQKTLGSKSNRSFPSVPSENFRPVAENAVGQIQVSNDGLAFNGQVLMDDGLYEATAPTPEPIPEAPLNSVDDLYLAQLMIPPILENGSKMSKGELVYRRVIDTENRSQLIEPIQTINDVTVHTPVVCYPLLNEISKETQQFTYDEARQQLVIGETFHVEYPKSGQHTNNRGYGERDYSQYFDLKQVTFPFDVYVGTGYDGIYFPKNTWGNFNSLEATFFIPSWEAEKEGDILFRSIPINTQNLVTDPFEYHANLDLTKYKAVESIPFHLSSKLYNFTVTECPDDYWTKVVSKNTPYKSADFPIKPKDVRKPQTPDYGVMLGYPIVFEMLTNGDLYDVADYIELRPYYDYVPLRNGRPDFSKRQAVDVYVSTYNQVLPFEGTLKLDRNKRTFIGESHLRPASIGEDVKKRSEQEWKGRFHLPNMAYFLPKGTDITKLGHINLGADPFLHDGYIIVGFEICVYKKGMRQYLGYKNGWTEEGFITNQGLETYRLGDVFIYSSSRRASQTYR
jgi:hypothetical protein